MRLIEEQQKDGQVQWAAMESISQKVGCTPETLQRWVRHSERDQGKRAGEPYPRAVAVRSVVDVGS